MCQKVGIISGSPVSVMFDRLKRDLLMSQTPNNLVLNSSMTSQEFLLECIRTILQVNSGVTIEQILEQDILDWSNILRQSALHRVSGVLFECLRNLKRNNLAPIEVMGQLEARYLQTVAKNLAFRSELRRILGALEDFSIDTIVLKGAALAEAAYGNIGLREMLDVDILVRPENADLAFVVVEKLGYSPKENIQKQQERRLYDEHYSQLFGHGNACIVEVHTNVLEVRHPLRFEMSGFWDRAVEVDIAGTRAMVLSPIDQLIHLSIHFFKDRHGTSYSALSQLLDMAIIMKQSADSFDWNFFTREAKSKGITGPIFLGLYLAKELFWAEVPGDVLASLRPQNFKIKDVDRFIRQRVFGHKAFANRLFDPKEPYNWRSVPLAVLRRILLREKHNIQSNGEGTRIGELAILGSHHYLNRVAAKLKRARNAVRHPVRLYEDIASDRWLHSLYSAGLNGKIRDNIRSCGN